MLLNLHRHTPHISIHAPSRERLSDSHRAAEYRRISIHAPSRERRIGFNKTFDTQGFQSTLPRGSDNPTRRPQPQERLFQSTLPRGSDVPGAPVYTLPIHFNPRSLAGATPIIFMLHFQLIFQSTLPRGSDRPYPRSSYGCHIISIHAPSRERLYGAKDD